MRCNTGVNPLYLPDQHIIAEQVELLMIGGMLRRNNYQPKSPIPEQFKLGTGHMLFWVNKMKYLKRRHHEVKKEVARRGFKVADREIDLDEFPKEFVNDWEPSKRDSDILRERLAWKLENKPNIWRYERNGVNILELMPNIKNGELFYV